jgi:hypothetical protein
MMEAIMAAFVQQPQSAGDMDQPSCSIWYIQMKLGRHDYSVRRMCTYVQLLISAHGFPLPFPRETRGRLVRDVSYKSRWPRSAVDVWLADFLPPETNAAIDAAAMRAAAETMDNRAGQLQLIKGGRA